MGYFKSFHRVEDKKILRLLNQEHEKFLRESNLWALAEKIARGEELSRDEALMYELFKVQPKYRKGDLRRIIKNFYECMRAFTHGLPDEVYEKFREAMVAALDEKNQSSEAFLKIVRGETVFPNGTSAKTHPDKFFKDFQEYIHWADELYMQSKKYTFQ